VSSSHLHPHAAELRHPDGSWKFTNALAGQTSPYLLQHAHNPVDWRPWGPDAFDLARHLDKPIFLSIGYSTCYWCHVMERQSFEDPATAAVMNEHFINIKVDREERPDVDDIYMTAVQAMTGRGGWPMSVFLTPPGAAGEDDRGLKPFFCGTYFPPRPAHGMASFTQVLTGLAQAWKNQRDEVVDQADRVAQAVREHLGRRDAAGDLDVKLVQQAANQLLRSYEPVHGGFGQAPKFPQPCNLQLLLKVQQNNPHAQLWQAVTHTLDRMARGGMYDQVGGGFHRYSTDEKWLVPHFEKMLYDNGQLLCAYAVAHGIERPAHDPDFYARVMRQTCDYLLREMTDAGGAFWSAQDAEVDAKEGDNYVWTADQVRQAIDDAGLADLTLELYGLDQGTNFRDPHDPQARDVNVLHLPHPLHELAAKRGMPLDELVQKQRQINAKLLAVRDRRKQPGTDDKVLTAWNGMAIAGLAMAGRVLDEPRYKDAAVRAADAVLTGMSSPDGGLFRSRREGQARIGAFLEDYAFFIQGLLELSHATGQARWLREAQRLASYTQEHFGDEAGGFYDTLADQADLFIRTRSTYDGAIPSGNSQMVHNLLELYQATREDSYLALAAASLRSFAGSMQRHGAAMAHMAHALLRALELAPQSLESAAASVQVRDGRQRRQAVTVRVEPEVVDLSVGPVTVRVTIDIDEEYHLNAHQPGLEDLIATALSLEDAAGLAMEPHYPPGKPRHFPFAPEPLNVYEDRVVLEATLSRTGPVTARPRLMLQYQVCTNQSCLQPREVELPITFEGLS
jgi:uncharacterized protein YyaL (SSP411 family)